jgi:pyrroline-5-carboxylate reductase|tara:strand:- start:675 stop:1487 length:813 start_codon:yes stop_codon:yes gene_type:complete
VSIAFIGAGNMAGSLVNGLIESGTSPSEIAAADPIAKQLEKLSVLGVVTAANNDQAIKAVDVIVLAVKPQVIGQVLEALSGLTPNQLIISIVAGIDLRSLETWLPANQPIVRCMPNTPALLGAGMTGLFANSRVTDQQKALATHILEAVGEVAWVSKEAHLDAVTAVSGSGPAYFFLLMENMIAAGQKLGLDAELSKKLTEQTAFGAALMAQKSNVDPGTLRKNVTSPGGTTEAALNLMLAQDFPATVIDALSAAEKRAKELAVEFGAKS